MYARTHPAVGVPDDVDLLGVDAELLLGLLQQARQVAHVVHAGVVKVTAPQPIPKMQAMGVDRAVGEQRHEPVRVHARAHAEQAVVVVGVGPILGKGG